MDKKNNLVKLEVNTYGFRDNESSGLYINKHEQTIAFKYDDFIKGNKVAVELTSESTGINVPGFNIYLDHNLLKNILKFLIDAEKDLHNEIEELKQLTHNSLPDECIKEWDEVKFCEHRQGEGNKCKKCSYYNG